MKKIVLFLMVLLCASFASASSMEITSVTNQVSPFDSAEYTLKVTNTGPMREVYYLSAEDAAWSLRTAPLTDYTSGLEVPAGQSKSTILFVKAREGTAFGTHSFRIMATPDSGSAGLSDIISINLREDLIVYDFDIDVEVIMPAVMDSRKTNSLKIALKNNNKKNIEDLNIKVSSSLFEEMTSSDLGSEKEKVVEFPITFQEGVDKEDVLTIELRYDGETKKIIEKDFKVITYPEEYKKQTTLKKSFLKRVTTLTFTNEGKIPVSETELIETSIFKRIFSTTDPGLKVVREDDIYYYTTTVELEPGKSAKVVITTNYRILIYILFAALLVLAGYFVFRPKLIATKFVKDVAIVEGGISKIKVILKVKNRTGKLIKNVHIYDKIPHIAGFVKEGFETVKPKKVYAYASGHVVSYEFPYIEPHGTLIVTYAVKTKLKVVGEFKLKPAIIRYGKKKVTSNDVNVYSP